MPTIDLTANADQVIPVIKDVNDKAALEQALADEKANKKRATVIQAIEEQLKAPDGSGSGGHQNIDFGTLPEADELEKHNLFDEFIGEYGSHFEDSDAALDAYEEFLDKDRNDPQNPTHIYTYRNKIVAANTENTLVNGPSEGKATERTARRTAGTALLNITHEDGTTEEKVFPLYNPHGPNGKHQQWDWHELPSGKKVRVSFHPDDVAAINGDQ